MNAIELKSMLADKKVAAPRSLIEKYPELRRFADPSEQGEAPPDDQLSLLA